MSFLVVPTIRVRVTDGIVSSVGVPVPALGLSDVDAQCRGIYGHEPSKRGGVVSSHHVVHAVLAVAFVAGEGTSVDRARRLHWAFVAKRKVLMPLENYASPIQDDARTTQVIQVIEDEARRWIVEVLCLADNSRGRHPKHAVLALCHAPRIHGVLRDGGSVVENHPDVLFAADEGITISIRITMRGPDFRTCRSKCLAIVQPGSVLSRGHGFVTCAADRCDDVIITGVIRW